MKKCPYCAEEIQDEAVFCRYCQRNIELPLRRLEIREWILIILLPGWALLVGLGQFYRGKDLTAKRLGKRLAKYGLISNLVWIAVGMISKYVSQGF